VVMPAAPCFFVLISISCASSYCQPNRRPNNPPNPRNDRRCTFASGPTSRSRCRVIAWARQGSDCDGTCLAGGMFVVDRKFWRSRRNGQPCFNFTRATDGGHNQDGRAAASSFALAHQGKAFSRSKGKARPLRSASSCFASSRSTAESSQNLRTGNLRKKLG
jgi:hypothetical protein